MQSLHSFCKAHNLAKSTVHSHLTALGHDLSQGLTDAAVADARAGFLSPADIPAATEAQPAAPTQTFTAGGLVPVASGGMTRTTQVFDAQQYQADKQALQGQTVATAGDINSMVTAYAQNRIASVLADIDLTADSIRANAMQAMGVEPAPKQSAA